MTDSLIDHIRRAATQNPNAPAFIFDNRIITYRRLLAFLREATKVLQVKGIGPGNVVGLSMSQSPLHCITMLALAHLGAITVPLNPSFPALIKQRIAQKFAMRLLVTDLSYAGIDGVPTFDLPQLDISGDAPALDAVEYRPDTATPLLIAMPLVMSMPPKARKNPKGILYTHGYMIDRMQKTLDGYNSATRLIPADLNFTMGFICALGTLGLGGVVIFPRTTTSADDLIAAIRLHAATHVFFPSELADQIDALLPDDGLAFPTLERMHILEGKPTPALTAKMLHKLSSNLYTSYGCAEMGGMTLATPEILATAPTSSGRARPWVEVQIVDADGKTLPPGKIGEIRGRGVLLPPGYHLDQKATRKKFRDGWFYTGNNGYLTADGLLYLQH